MSRPQKILRALLAAFLLFMLSLLIYLFSGSSAIESWVGTQLLDLGAAYLNPTLHFERLTYIRPKTILLDNLTLTSPDPAHQNRPTTILAVKHARLELTEIPRRGQPIKFSTVTFDSPQFHAVATPADGLLGFSHLMKRAGDASASRPAPATSAAAPVASTAATAAASPTTAPSFKLSDILLIRQIQITNGTASFDAPDSPPVWLDAINAQLNFAPEASKNSANVPASPALYTFNTAITRPPHFTLELQGHLNIDTFLLELSKLDLNLDLREKNAHLLPPDLQKFLQTFELKGNLRLTANGQLPLTRLRDSALLTQGQLSEARVAARHNRISIDNLAWQLEMKDGATTLSNANATLLGGELHAAGTIPTDSAQPAHLDLHAANVQIQQLFRPATPGDPPNYSGNLGADISFNAPLGQWKNHAAGTGSFTIRQGRIDKLPVLGSIITVLNDTLSKTLGNGKKAQSDSADGSFTFAGDHVEFDQFTGISGALAFRATGKLGFDRTFDLRLNAGPLERLQSSLGAIGDLWASASDAISAYRVTGTLDHPEVSLELGPAK